jgi:hypothetical protein
MDYADRTIVDSGGSITIAESEPLQGGDSRGPSRVGPSVVNFAATRQVGVPLVTRVNLPKRTVAQLTWNFVPREKTPQAL